MRNLIVSGVDRSTVRRRVKAGTYYKVCKGLYLTRAPTARELLGVLLATFPAARATGCTAEQLFYRRELSFPLQLVSTRDMPDMDGVEWFRSRRSAFVWMGEYRVHLPCLAIEYLEEPRAIALLEHVYKNRNGKRAIEKHAAGVRFPARSRDLLRKAVIGADSGGETVLIRALKNAGLAVENNVFLGAYWWDIYVPELNLLVEVDGFKYHSSENLEIFVRDRAKANDATLAGYVVLRFTGSCVANELDRVVAQILSVRTMPNPLPTQGVWEWHWIFRRSDRW
ncbi:DUF559 domain-containing protein [Corynebacterium sp. zg-331]|uniref:endonuclease domain-containing protein n=1 Tax=unclassified Corynebacterium TaxID=2624378 RepID=UPI00128C142E|nr:MULTISPECIES: DUF559 domain-containing protein [unclassified Corynebacterium]MBC3186107.1 DUF559 domain-containing protein [Corynebacterium sp. zg-331]MPV52597.1 DUF559 domain-containing protein [Corynebacterium sp. zg331]